MFEPGLFVGTTPNGEHVCVEVFDSVNSGRWWRVRGDRRCYEMKELLSGKGVKIVLSTTKELTHA